MKNNILIRSMIYILIVSIYLPTIAFAVEPTQAPIPAEGETASSAKEIFKSAVAAREDKITADSEQSSLIQSKSAIIIQSPNDGRVGNSGVIGNIVIEPDKGFCIVNDDLTTTPLLDIRIMDSNGEVADVSGMVYNPDNKEYIIELNEDNYFPDYDVRQEYKFSVVCTIDGKEIILTEFEVKGSEYIFLEAGEPGRLDFWGLLTNTENVIIRMVETILNDMLIPLGDGVLYLVSKSVGEVVTIDGLIFGDVKKVSINYFDTAGETGNSIKAIMRPVVNTLYNLFFQIAVIVYMMMLVVTGIQVMLQSTANKRAKYKEYMVSWLVGVCILMFFPFVMKYIIALNNAFVTSIGDYMGGKRKIITDEQRAEKNARLNEIEDGAACKLFGKDGFVELMIGSTYYNTHVEIDDKIYIRKIPDVMLQTRVMAQKLGRIVLTIIYFILIGQTIVVLVMYYKRTFMLAFLITIFPLVAMSYAVDKAGDKKAQSFGIWSKEYIVNVIVQMFHATVYALLVGGGVKTFIETEGSNWMFLIISTLFLFQGEKILRNIFNIKSSANTIGDLAATGVMVYGVAKKISDLKPSKDKGQGKDGQDERDARNRLNENRAQRTIQQANPINTEADEGGAPSNRQELTGPANAGQYTGNDSEGVEHTGYDGSTAKDSVVANALKRRLTKGSLSGVANSAGKGMGFIMGATYGMSKGDTGKGGLLGEAFVGATAGKAIGEGLNKPLVSALNKVEQVRYGNKLAEKIENGDMDAALTLGNMPPPNIDENKIIGENGETVQEIYRQALAEMARITARKGKAKGELAYWTYIDKHTKKD